MATTASAPEVRIEELVASDEQNAQIRDILRNFFGDTAPPSNFGPEIDSMESPLDVEISSPPSPQPQQQLQANQELTSREMLNGVLLIPAPDCLPAIQHYFAHRNM
eukprot:c24826_g1_i1.p1 GENE.c24826_g1_i1~~c24826_g1_i1.p1  ORF type:complete len:114 (-),score=27.37 c24826_g1_i1:25-342(-)